MTRCRRVVVVRVSDAEPASRAEHARFEFQLVAKPDQQVQHYLHRLLVGAEGEDLRPDVRVQPDDIEARMPPRFGDRIERGPNPLAEPELAPPLPGQPWTWPAS